jgi:hypothetical protein
LTFYIIPEKIKMTTKNELFEIIGLYYLECCSVNVSLVKECTAHATLP